jgi:SPP1 family predicted phage head-tail adaptor
MTFSDTLRHKISIQAPGADRDAAGQPIEAPWTEIAAPWADVRVLGGLETIKAGAVTALTKASIRIRYRTGIDTSMRVVHDGTVYQVQAILPDMARKQYVDLVCEVVK